jgi:molybdopterin biosynthesis enzyme MoaB
VRVAILTISDRASRGEYEDRSGPEIERVLREAQLGGGADGAAGPASTHGLEIVREIVPDDAATIRAALDRFAGGGTGVTAGPVPPAGAAGDRAAAPGSGKDAAAAGAAADEAGPAGEADFILTTGGTGLGPRDVTPDVTREWCERDLPGVAEAIRAASLAETNTAMLSRGYAGVRGRTIVVNLPGSVRGAGFAAGVIAPVMEHAVSMLRGGGH